MRLREVKGVAQGHAESETQAQSPRHQSQWNHYVICNQTDEEQGPRDIVESPALAEITILCYYFNLISQNFPFQEI